MDNPCSFNNGSGLGHVFLDARWVHFLVFIFDTRFPLHGRPRGKKFSIVPLIASNQFSEGWLWYAGNIPSMALQVWHVCLLPKKKLWKRKFLALFELCILTIDLRSPLRSSKLQFLFLFAFFGPLWITPGSGSSQNGIDDDSFLPLNLALRQRKCSSRLYNKKIKAGSRKKLSELSRPWFKGTLITIGIAQRDSSF